MFNNEYRTIGLFICGVLGSFQKKICKRLTEYTREKGYNLAIFNSFKDYKEERNDAYITGEANIVNLPNYDDLDGIIIIPDGYKQESLNKYFIPTLRKKAKCPVISVLRQVEGFSSVVIDNRNAMESIIEHFIKDHKMTKLAYVGGPNEHPDSVERLACFRKTMAKNKVAVREDWILEGTFWYGEGAKHIDYFLGGDKKDRPEAIICANDYMAVDICDECVSRGILIPQEVAISGFDNLPESQTCFPPLTTADVSVDEIIEKCFAIIEDEEVKKGKTAAFKIKPQVIRRASCGCEVVDVKSVLGIVKYVRDDYDNLYWAARSNTYMAIRMQKLDEYRNIGKIIGDDYNNFKDLYICMCEKNKKDDDGALVLTPRIKGYPSKMNCVYGFSDRKAIVPTFFNTKNIVPEIPGSKGPVQLYCTPLHYLNYTFGYVAHAYDDSACFDKTFQNWMAVVGNAVENIRTKYNYSKLVDKLNDLYLHESMTGLYNRRGFDNLSSKMYDLSIKEQKKMMLLEVDMDNLKQVNDRHGHSEGDRAIDIIAKSLKKVAGEGVICARVGGDEFWVVAYDYSKEMMEEYVKKFKVVLENLDSKDDKPYSVSVSYGSVITDPSSGINLEEYINIVDARMYRNKREHKKNESVLLN